MKAVVLVGFMGTGKTAVGQALARRLQVPYLDTDERVAALAGRSITRIFTEQGESHFRALETQVLLALVAEGDQARVIATGGGIVLPPENWPLLKRLGPVVCLTAEPETIWRRVGQAQDRPLLAGTHDEVRLRIEKLLRERQSAYAQADWCLKTDQHFPAEIAKKIMEWRNHLVDHAPNA